MSHESPDAELIISEIVERLAAQFADYPTPKIREVVAQSYTEFDGVRVRDFVEVLVEKQARNQLKQLVR